MAENKKSTPDTPESGAKEAAKEKMTAAKSAMMAKMKSEAQEIENTIAHLPMSRKLVFFLGFILLLCSLLALVVGGAIGLIGNIISLLIGIGGVYAGYNEKNAIKDWLDEQAKKEQK